MKIGCFFIHNPVVTNMPCKHQTVKMLTWQLLQHPLSIPLFKLSVKAVFTMLTVSSESGDPNIGRARKKVSADGAHSTTMAKKVKTYSASQEDKMRISQSLDNDRLNFNKIHFLPQISVLFKAL